MLDSLFGHKIILSNPDTKQGIIELYQHRLPLMCLSCCQEEVRATSASTSSDEFSNNNNSDLLGFIRQGMAFHKVWYDVYDYRRDHILSVMLKKSHIKRKILHEVPEFEIVGGDETTSIGRIYPYSTDTEMSDYGNAIAIKLPQDMQVKTKATLIASAIVMKQYLS